MLKTGTSDRIITPEIGIELCGYLDRVQPSTGKYDDLFARTLYIEDSGNKLLWVHCDLIGFSNELADRIRNNIAKATSLVSANIVLSATHTHAGPATVFLRQCGDIAPSYIEFLEKTIIESAQEAMRAPEEVTMHFSETTVESISMDRTKSKKISHVDYALPVLAFKKRNGEIKAVFTNFAMHNVGLSSENRNISADIAGFAALRASSLIKGNPVVFLTNGGCGNIDPIIENDDYSGVEKIGTILGDSIVAEIPRLKECSDTSISSFFMELELPLDIMSQGELMKILEIHNSRLDKLEKNYFNNHRRETYRLWGKETLEIIEKKRALKPAIARAHIVKIGAIVLIGINAEVFSHMADQLRSFTNVQKLYITGYTDGCIGYLAPQESYEEGGYAVNDAYKFYAHFRFKAGGFEFLRDKIASFAKNIQKSLS